jgi:hypothetical protein
MSANTVILRAAISAKLTAETDLDALAVAEANVLLDRYIAALDAQSSMESGAISSYSIAGRTITRRDPGQGQPLIEDLRRQLYAYFRDDVILTDMGGFV